MKLLVPPPQAPGEPPSAPPVFVRAYVVGSRRPEYRRTLVRSAALSPYTAQTIAEDALQARPEARLEVAVAPDLSACAVEVVEREFAWLRSRGVQVRVRRDKRGALRLRNTDLARALSGGREAIDRNGAAGARVPAGDRGT